VFVAGHSYLDAGYSTRTVIRSVTGADPNYGSLEAFSVTKEGKEFERSDVNVWGVTFAADSNTFYATVSSGGRNWLAKGNVTDRSMSLIREGVECPSLSPDNTKIAYKKVRATDGQWDIHVLTLADGTDVKLGETHSVDDQVQWLTDTTVMYQLPRVDEAPRSDVWAADLDGSPPRLLIPDASSPSLVNN